MVNSSAVRPLTQRTTPMEPVIYFDRAFRPEREATVSVRSRALNYGLGCFAAGGGVCGLAKGLVGKRHLTVLLQMGQRDAGPDFGMSRRTAADP